MIDAATIKLFLPYGDAKRLRTAELSNWTGKAIAAPRSDLEELIARPELDQPGIYVLTGVDPSNSKPQVYVGEAEVIRNRIKQHVGKEFWNHAIVFVSKDENLTKAHIRYLEGAVIAEAGQIGRAELMNAQGSGSKLPESDRADMEVYLARVRQLLPVLGSNVLTPVPDRSASPTETLTCEIVGLTATGVRSADGFVVFEGSQARVSERRSAADYLRAERARLLDEGALIEHNGYFTFTKDVEFSSPSMAAGVVCGGNMNGLTAWKDQQGRTLKTIEAQ